MWNKKENESPNAPAPSGNSPAPAPSSRPSSTRSAVPAVIGPSIAIKGDLTGEEDLMIEGRVEGEIRLKQHSVTVGRSGRVQADVFGKSINVEGEVQGNLTGDSEVVIRNTGRVEGNIVAPRVTLEDGSSFRGAIDMQTPQQAKQTSAPAAKPEAQKPQKGGSSSPQTSEAPA